MDPEDQPAPAEQLTADAAAVEAKDRKLSAENAAWRVKFRGAEQTIETMRKEMEQMKAAQVVAGNSGDAPAEAARLARELAEHKARLSTIEQDLTREREATRTKTQEAKLGDVVSSLGALERDSAKALLRHKSRVSADGVVVFAIVEDGEEREVEATPETVRKYNLLPAIYYPAEGVSGTGSRGVRSAAGGVDLDRATKDAKYYEQNRDAIRQARAGR